MFPDKLLERNRTYVAARKAQPLPEARPLPLAIIACFDPRLDDLLRPALGLGPGEGFLIRTAGAVVTPATLRSLTVAVYLFEVRQVLVVGHSGCRMAKFPTTAFVDAFRRRGVTRAAFGNEDLRVWAGAISNPRQGVLSSVAAIGHAAVLPSDLELAGAVLDDTTGELKTVFRPGDALPLATAPPAGMPAVEWAGPVTESVSVTESVPVTVSGKSESSEPPQPPGSSPGLELAALETVRSTIESLTAKSGFRNQLSRLRVGLERESNPLKQLHLLRQFVKSGAADTPAIRASFEELKHLVSSPHTINELISSLLGSGSDRGKKP